MVCRMLMPQIGSGKTISFTILLVLNISCDVIYLVIYLIWPHQFCWSTCAAIGLVQLQSSKKPTRDCISSCRPFLSRVSILTRDIDIANLSVCLSVRNVPVSDENGLTYRHSFFHHTVAQSFCFHQLVLPASNIFTKFRRGHPMRGAKYRWGIKISQFSTNKSLYLTNDARYRYSYYGRRIGNRIQTFKCYYFQWSSVTSNPHFKVTILFSVK